MRILAFMKNLMSLNFGWTLEHPYSLCALFLNGTGFEADYDYFVKSEEKKHNNLCRKNKKGNGFEFARKSKRLCGVAIC